MQKKIIILCTVILIVVMEALFALIGALMPGPFTGTVTDAETNEPIANVSVSDGRNVVKTDENGAYTLPGYSKSRFVTVTTPAGYWTENYYIPVTKDRETYDFRLDKSEKTAQADHSFLQISDSEIGAKGVGAWIEHVRDTVKETDPAFLIHTGDICYEDGLKQHIKDMNTENMGVPVRYVIGNHDYVAGKYGEALFESIYGPVWYSFDVGNVHYVVTPFQTGADYASGYNKNDRWKWLENDLANVEPGMKVVMFNHTKAPSDDYVLSYGLKKLDLKEHDLIAWVYGHYHYNYITETDGVLNISTGRPDCGGIDSSASGSRLISITANGQVSTQMYYYDFEQPQAPDGANWSAQLEGNLLFADPLAVGNQIFAATVDDDYPRTCGVYSLNAADGSVNWFFKTLNSVKNKLVYANGKIVAQDCEGTVYCLNAETGALLWQKKVDLGGSLGTSSGLCADGSTVYAGCAASITALDLETGDTRWNTRRGKGENSPAEFVIAGDRLIVSSHWDALVALNKNTGKKLWENSDSNIRFRSSTPAVIDANTLLVADDDAIMIVDNGSGKITSKTNFDDYNFASSAQPVISGKVAYIATVNKGVLAFDLETKTILWEREVGGALVGTAPYAGVGSKTVEGPPILSNGKLIFGASDGYLYAIDPANGAVLKKQNVGAPVFGSVALSNGNLIVADFAGRITSF